MMDWGKKVSQIKKAVSSPKPGFKSQLTMVIDPRPGHKTYLEIKDRCKKAGVLILVFPWKEQSYLILTRRTELVQYHPNQISFPGGQCEPEENPSTTALRETHEELGIDPAKIKTVGQLTPLYIPPSDYCIYPSVGISDQRPEYFPRIKEVAEVIEIPILHLLEDKNLRKEIWELNGKKVRVPFYEFEDHKIWGATAMVLAEFLDIIRPVFKKKK